MKTVHTYLFVSRNKDNKGLDGFRQRSMGFLSVLPIDVIFDKFNKFCQAGVEGETCRLYESVNARDLDKVKKNLSIYLISQDNSDCLLKLESLACSIADKPECAAEKKWMFDFDSGKDDLVRFLNDLSTCDISIDLIHTEVQETVSGYCVITEHGFDTRKLMENWNSVCSLKRDGMRLLVTKRLVNKIPIRDIKPSWQANKFLYWNAN